MIGRHFLVYSKDQVFTKRQYTICNTVEPALYAELLKLCNQKFNDLPCEPILLNAEDQDSVYVTCKDYHTKKGVATQLNGQQID